MENKEIINDSVIENIATELVRVRGDVRFLVSLLPKSIKNYRIDELKKGMV